MQHFSRRDLVIGAAVTGTALFAAPSILRAQTAAAPAGPFRQPALPFKDDALAPTISAQTVALHYGKHHASYFTNLNKLTENTPYAGMKLEEVMVKAATVPADVKIFNNAGQAWNHIVYWDQFKPGGARQPSGKLAAAIDADLGGLQKLKDSLVETGNNVFGSGWAWLVLDGGKLSVQGTAGGDNPDARGKKALLGIDVWEHAYYLDYQNRRGDHLKAVLDNLINWDVVRDRMA
jgi:Fe-Mn family superoxide dismutase